MTYRSTSAQNERSFSSLVNFRPNDLLIVSTCITVSFDHFLVKKLYEHVSRAQVHQPLPKTDYIVSKHTPKPSLWGKGGRGGGDRIKKEREKEDIIYVTVHGGLLWVVGGCMSLSLSLSLSCRLTPGPHSIFIHVPSLIITLTQSYFLGERK